MLYLVNSFSLNMIGESYYYELVPEFELITLERARELYIGSGGSAIGHADTAILFSKMLGVYVPCERKTLHIDENDALLIGQYKGPRLPEGCTVLPKESRIDWYFVQMKATLKEKFKNIPSYNPRVKVKQ